MAEIVGIGSALFDTLMQIDGFPQEDTKMQGGAAKLQGGGPCATALCAAARLGVSAAYMGTLGDDMYGEYIRAGLQRCGVDTSRVRAVKGAVSYHSFVLLNTRRATRTCVWSKGTLPEAGPDDIDPAFLRQAKFLHLDGHQLSAARRAAQLARECGVAVSLDAGGRYPGIETLLPLVDILIPSEEFALGITGCAAAEDAAAKLWQQYHPRTLIVTQGSRGGFLYTPQGPCRYPVYPVQAVDTNGAGDTFHGAFLAGRCRGMTDAQAADWASAVSALKCTRFGAQDGIPTAAEAEAFRQSRRTQ